MNRREFCRGLLIIGAAAATSCIGRKQSDGEPTIESTRIPPLNTPRLAPTLTLRSIEAVTPVNQRDLDNQRLVEQALPGDVLTLENPNITSIWQIPWATEGDEPNVATVALLWGQEHPSAVITSAACIRDFYKDRDMLENAMIAPPLTSLRVWELQGDVRPENLVVKMSDYTNQANAKSMDVVGPGGEVITVGCEETSDLERFKQFLNRIDWSELPGEAGELTGEILGDFVRGLIEGLRDNG